MIISTYIVKITNHIMGKMWLSYCIFFWFSSCYSTTWAYQTIRKFVWFYGLLQRWTSLIFCQYLNSFVERRITLPLNFYMNESRLLLFYYGVWERGWDNSGEYMDHVWLLEISRLPSEKHQPKRFESEANKE